MYLITEEAVTTADLTAQQRELDAKIEQVVFGWETVLDWTTNRIKWIKQTAGGTIEQKVLADFPRSFSTDSHAFQQLKDAFDSYEIVKHGKGDVLVTIYDDGDIESFMGSGRNERQAFILAALKAKGVVL